MVAILQQLLLSDNDAVQNAQTQLKAFMKQSDSLTSLATVLTANQEDGVRQMAATLLRQRITKSWIRVPADAKAYIKQILLTCVIGDKSYVGSFHCKPGGAIAYSGRWLFARSLWRLIASSNRRRSVRQAIARVISIIAKHEVPNNEWSEFMPWLSQCTSSEDVQVREVCADEAGLYLYDLASCHWT